MKEVNYLNTYHVNVNQIVSLKKRTDYKYLNTYHVNVNQSGLKANKIAEKYLNTYHVNVNQFFGYVKVTFKFI